MGQRGKSRSRIWYHCVSIYVHHSVHGSRQLACHIADGCKRPAVDAEIRRMHLAYDVLYEEVGKGLSSGRQFIDIQIRMYNSCAFRTDICGRIICQLCIHIS